MHMKNLLVFIICCGMLGSIANATPLGRLEYADLTSINGQPAICLPGHAKAPFAVGWVILAESFARNTGIWGVSLKEGGTPVVLNPGECFSYGDVPAAYELVRLGRNEHPVVLETNKTYSFLLQSASQSKDVYNVVFCIGEGRSGQFEFYKRSPSSSREQAALPCKASGSNSASE